MFLCNSCVTISVGKVGKHMHQMLAPGEGAAEAKGARLTSFYIVKERECVSVCVCVVHLIF